MISNIRNLKWNKEGLREKFLGYYDLLLFEFFTSIFADYKIYPSRNEI